MLEKLTQCNELHVDESMWKAALATNDIKMLAGVLRKPAY